MSGSSGEQIVTNFNVPIEIYQETLYYLPLASVLNMCEVNKYSYQVCHSDKFWKEYTVRNYPEYIDKYNHYLSVKELGDAKWVDVYDESAGFRFPLKLNKEMTLVELKDAVRKIAYDERPIFECDYMFTINNIYHADSYDTLIDTMAGMVSKYGSGHWKRATKNKILAKAKELYDSLIIISIKKNEDANLGFRFV
jgi:hypothetical protein